MENRVVTFLNKTKYNYLCTCLLFLFLKIFYCAFKYWECDVHIIHTFFIRKSRYPEVWRLFDVEKNYYSLQSIQNILIRKCSQYQLSTINRCCCSIRSQFPQFLFFSPPSANKKFRATQLIFSHLLPHNFISRQQTSGCSRPRGEKSDGRPTPERTQEEPNERKK